VEKTAVITPFGLYEYIRMPFGLRNAGQTFQRVMDQSIGGLEYCFVYLDDILIASSSPEEHARHLEAVFGRIREAGLLRVCRASGGFFGPPSVTSRHCSPAVQGRGGEEFS
jgi:hypothetical protein